MNEQHETNETEILGNEDWCTVCHQNVYEWRVFFETSNDSECGYDKIRRCPHCNAKCFADRSSGFGTFFFLLGFFGSILWAALFKNFDIELHGGFFICLMFAHGIVVSLFATWLWKKRLYSGRHTRQPKGTVANPYEDRDHWN